MFVLIASELIVAPRFLLLVEMTVGKQKDVYPPYLATGLGFPSLVAYPEKNRIWLFESGFYP